MKKIIYHAQRNFQSTMQGRKYYNGHCKVIKIRHFSMFCVFIWMGIESFIHFVYNITSLALPPQLF